MDTKFVRQHNLKPSPIPPKQLRLFDGSSGGIISESVTIPIRFSSGETLSVEFLVTPLDLTWTTVLGYNWLTLHNPLIDWVTSSITFRTPTSSPPKSTPPPSVAPPIPDPPPPTDAPPVKPHISMISAEAFVRAAKLEGSQTFMLRASVISETPRANSADLSDVPPDPVFYERVPPEHHDYADVFSEGKSNRLPPHRSCDHHIDLEEGTTLPLGRIYSLSVAEQDALRIFIDEHLRKGWIRQSNSLEVPLSSLSERKTVSSAFALTTVASTRSPRKTVTHFCSSPTYSIVLVKDESTLRSISE
jgi:hypothetical protein